MMLRQMCSHIKKTKKSHKLCMYPLVTLELQNLMSRTEVTSVFNWSALLIMLPDESKVSRQKNPLTKQVSPKVDA